MGHRLYYANIDVKVSLVRKKGINEKETQSNEPEMLSLGGRKRQ